MRYTLRWEVAALRSLNAKLQKLKLWLETMGTLRGNRTCTGELAAKSGGRREWVCQWETSEGEL